MLPDKILVWTPRGYIHAQDLSPGDRVISYNSARNCTEYDVVSEVKTEWQHVGLIGPKKVGLHFTTTPDHPVLITDVKTRELTKVTMNSIFMDKTPKNKALLGCKPFEPYKRSQDDEFIEWTARMAASSIRHKRPPLYSDEIWKCIQDITGEEAQLWLNTFFHWNILQPRTHYMKTVFAQSSFVMDMVYHVAPRAGVGTYWGPHRTRWGRNRNAISITLQQDHIITVPTQWRADKQDGTIYNISTHNGSFLGKYLGGVFLMGCNVS